MADKTYIDDAERYDRIFKIAWLEPLADPELINLIKKIKKKKIIYEPGCGTGLLTEKIAGIEGIESIIAVDSHEIYLKKARKRLKKYSSVIQVISADALTYDLPQPADLVVARYVYHHIPDEQKMNFLKKLADNLRPEGRIFIVDIFIPPYSSEQERDESLKRLHNYKKELVRGNQFLMDIEEESLVLGLRREEEYKVSIEIFKRHIQEAGLNLDSLKLIEDPRISNPELNGLYIAILNKL